MSKEDILGIDPYEEMRDRILSGQITTERNTPMGQPPRILRERKPLPLPPEETKPFKLEEAIKTEEESKTKTVKVSHQDIGEALAIDVAYLKEENKKLEENLSATEFELDTVIDRLRRVLSSAHDIQKKRTAGPRTILNLMAKGLNLIIKEYDNAEAEKAEEAKK